MEWAHHPVTLEHLQEIKESRQETLEAWAKEKFTAATSEQTVAANATALGGIRVLDQMIEHIETYQKAIDSEVNLVPGVHHEQ